MSDQTMSDGANRELRFLLGLAELPRAALESAALVASAPWLNLAPRGDGHHVMVLPGFAADDESTQVLRSFLDQRGFHARPLGNGT